MKFLEQPIVLAAAIAVGGSAAASASPQGQINPQLARGMASVWSAGISLRDDTSGSSLPTLADPLLTKPPLDQNNPLPIWSNQSPVAGIPSYTMAEMFEFSSYPGVAIYQHMEIDAHSTGNDRVPRMSSLGVPALGGTSDNWLAYTVSVKNVPSGKSGSYLASLANPGSEILSYYAERSVNIAQELPGKTYIEQRRADLGYAGMGQKDVDALDFALGAWTYNPNGLRTHVLFLAGYDFYYFSVTPDFVSWWNGHAQLGPNAAFAGGDAPHAAHVYRIGWDGTEWSDPEIYRRAEHLSYGSYEIEDIDALSVNGLGQMNTMIFSITATPQNDSIPQLLYYQDNGIGAGGTPTNPLISELLDENKAQTKTTPVFDKLGLRRGRDDPDSLCSWDPEGGDIDPVMGTSITSTLRIPGVGDPGSDVAEPMGISMHVASAGASGNPDLHLQITGWGGAPQDYCWLFVFSRVQTSGLTPNEDPFTGREAEWVAWPAVLRTPTMHKYEMTIPNLALFNGTYVDAFAVLMPLSPIPGGPLALSGSLVSELKY